MKTGDTLRRFQRSIAEAASNPWFMLVAGASSIVAFFAYLYEKIDPHYGSVSQVFLGLALALLGVGYYYSVRVRTEVIALRDMARIFYDINEIYKRRLQESFFGNDPMTNAEDLLDSEKHVLGSVCQRIQNIFSMAIHRNCMVTVKLVTREDGQVYAHTYVRSQDLSQRDNPERTKFSVGTGENTAFDQSLMLNADGRPAHFFSADLTKQRGYSNQRQHYLRHYKSTLVVPIRSEKLGSTGTSSDHDHIGYLCVDTLSINRLNDRYHLYMLAGLSHQMYNFMSLMRGRYTVFVET